MHYPHGLKCLPVARKPGFNLSSSYNKHSKKWYLIIIFLALNILRYRSIDSTLNNSISLLCYCPYFLIAFWFFLAATSFTLYLMCCKKQNLLFSYLT